MADCHDCFMDCLCCLCFRMCDKYDFIEPKVIEFVKSEESTDPDYIPLYLKVTGTDDPLYMDISGMAQHKYANLAP